MNKLDLLFQALEAAWMRMDERAHWPIPATLVSPYIARPEVEDLYPRLRFLDENGVSKHTVASLFRGPSMIREALPEVLSGLTNLRRRQSLSREDAIWLVTYFFEILDELMAGDIFCLDGKNAILTQSQVRHLMQTTHWLPESDPDFESLKTSLHKLSSSLVSLMWALYYFAWTNIGFEIHGPYDVSFVYGPGSVLLVRDFFHLKPVELWPTIIALPYESIRLLAVYKDVQVDIDYFDHMVFRGNLPDSTVSLSVEVDSVSVGDSVMLAKVNDCVISATVEQAKTIEQLRQTNRKDLSKKYIETRYYLYHDLREFCQRRFPQRFKAGWYPPFDMDKRIDLVDADTPPAPPMGDVAEYWAGVKEVMDFRRIPE